MPRFPVRSTDTTPMPLVRVGGPNPGGPGGPPPLQVGNWHAQQPPPGGPQRRSSSRALGIVLKGLGLVGVAVLSGLIWLTVHGSGQRGGSQNGQASTIPQGTFPFTPVRQNVQDSNCGDHAYKRVKDFFGGSQCTQLTRSLYTTTVPDGGKVLVSVAVVQMTDASQATQLKALVDSNGTGNVYDLVAEGQVKVPGGPPKGVAGGGYASTVRDAQVTIVESDFFPGHPEDDALLGRVSVDALRLGTG